MQQVAEAILVLPGHDVVPHLLNAAEAAQRSLDWPSATLDYNARMAPSPIQQRIWELPELPSDPSGLDQGQRASVVAAHDQLVAELKALQRSSRPRARSC